MPNNVLCTVRSCHYNNGKDLCLADNIEVIGSAPDVRASGGTDCETFKPKEKQPY